jgi:hypothetical protein
VRGDVRWDGDEGEEEAPLTLHRNSYKNWEFYNYIMTEYADDLTLVKVVWDDEKGGRCSPDTQLFPPENWDPPKVPLPHLRRVSLAIPQHQSKTPTDPLTFSNLFFPRFTNIERLECPLPYEGNFRDCGWYTKAGEEEYSEILVSTLPLLRSLATSGANYKSFCTLLRFPVLETLILRCVRIWKLLFYSVLPKKLRKLRKS